jgi:hypothetical protein
VTPPAGHAASLPCELHDARELPDWVASPKAPEPPESTQVGDPVAASHGGQPLLSCGAGGSRDPARGRGRTDDLGPCRPGPTPAESLRGGASVEIAQGKGNPEGTDGDPEPGSGRRERAGARRTRGTRGRRAKGENLAGKREAGGKPAEGTAGREVRPQTSRARARGSGAARICGGAGSWRGARTAHGRPPASWQAT